MKRLYNMSFSVQASPIFLVLPKSKRNMSMLPSSLKAIVPPCAQPCLASYIESTFTPSICSNSTNLQCLCSHYSPSGYTIGEVSLACLDSDCPDSDQSEATKVYQACGQQAGAVAPTHSVLTLFSSPSAAASTATVTSTSLLAASQTGTTKLTSQATTTITSIKAVPPIPAGQTLQSTMTTSLPPSPALVTTAIPGPMETKPASTGSSGLSNAQAIGVSIAAVGTLIIVIGVIFLLVCIRRRKAAKVNKGKETHGRHSFDFVDTSPPLYSPSRHVHQGFRGPLGGLAEQRSELPEQSSPTRFIRSAKQPERSTDTYASSDVARSSSLRSVASQRTVSQLLPDRPTHSPDLVRQQARPDSTATKATLFEEDKTPGLHEAMSHFPIPPSPTQARNVRRASEVPKYATHYNRSPNEARQPNLCVRIPTNRTRYARLSSPTGPDVVKPERAHVNPLSSHSRASQGSMAPGSAVSYLPSYYTSNDSRTPVLLNTSPQMFRDGMNHDALLPMPVSRAFRASQASDTSFESVDPEEATPPEEQDKQLSPLAESPISGLRYPKVPRSSNQAIPRSPPIASPTRPLHEHSESLLAKRRGAYAADRLERRLWMTKSSRKGSSTTISSDCSGDSMPEPPRRLRARKPSDAALEGQGKGLRGPPPPVYTKDLVVDSPDSPDMSLKSPLWEPKLTPSRRGDDLYISVKMP